MSDTEKRLVRLRRKLELETDLEERDDLVASIGALEVQLATQTIGDQARVGNAVSGGVQGNLTSVQGDVTGLVISGEVRSLFPEGSTSNYLTGVLNIFLPSPTVPQADYQAALQRYLEDLYNQHATVDLRGVDDRQVQPPLRDLYISLSLSEPQADDLRRGIRRFMARVADTVKLHSVANDLTEAERPRQMAWPDALRTHPWIAVIGAPGSGKTTLLHYTAIRLAEAIAHDNQALLHDLGFNRPFIPILLPLRELGQYIASCDRRELIGNNPRLLLGCIRAYAERNLDLPVDFFDRLCEEGRAILLLDGLDEVASTQDRQVASCLLYTSPSPRD